MLQQAEEVRKSFGYEAMQGTVLPQRYQSAASAAREILDPLGCTQSHRGQIPEQRAVGVLERRW